MFTNGTKLLLILKKEYPTLSCIACPHSCAATDTAAIDAFS